MDFSGIVRKRYLEQAAYTPAAFLISGLAVLNETDIQYKTSKNKRLSVELALLRLCHLQNAIDLTKELSSAVKKKPHQSNNTESFPAPDAEVEFPLASKEAATANPEQKTEIRNTVSVSHSIKLTSLDNLKKELREKPKEEELLEIEKEDVVFDEIDKYAFQQIWKSYLIKIKSEKKQVVFQILEAFPPEIIDEKTVRISVGTKSYLNTLNSEREEMYYFLKKELDKKAIDLIIQVDQQKSKVESLRKPYTPGEKFTHMVKKNPKLQEFS
jgi:DNA polymerase-3 subunit gamma/tau